MATPIRLATRASALAMTQTKIVARLLEAAGADVELVEVTTSGDLDQTSPVAELTEIGAFVRSVQRAVLEGSADAAVHSCKDLPTDGPPQLAMVVPQRANPVDVLVGAPLDELPEGARIGTGSPRRTTQLLQLRPDLRIDEIRGNVDSRLRMVASRDYDGAVLAAAGLERLGRTDAISETFSIEQMVPAPAQGAIAVEFLADGPLADVFASIEDPAAARAVAAERELLSQTGAGCRSALGALASANGTWIGMEAFVADERGPRRARQQADSPAAVARLMRAELGL